MKGRASVENLSRVLLDPAVNILFEQMRRMIKEKDEKIEKLTAEMEAVQYSTSALLGRRLLTKCTSLITENEELGNLVGAGILIPPQHHFAHEFALFSSVCLLFVCLSVRLWLCCMYF